ncbi:MAG: hypothetical protein KM310_10920 [Clostridiales bacterium]|nr:hypothetical protein [Clostridiales bacterium]
MWFSWRRKLSGKILKGGIHAMARLGARWRAVSLAVLAVALASLLISGGVHARADSLVASPSGDPWEQIHDRTEAPPIINRMIKAINDQNLLEYISCFSKENRELMEQFLTDNPNQAFKEQSAILVSIKELPKQVGVAAGGLVTRDQSLDKTRFFYAEIKFKVDREEKWLYNGINHRLIVLTEEDDGWKIAGIIVPSIRVLVESGYGFGTAAEQKAAEIEEMMERKGLVANYEGKIIANLAADKTEPAKEKQTDLSAVPKVLPTATDEHVKPSNIRVYLTYQVNKD